MDNVSKTRSRTLHYNSTTHFDDGDTTNNEYDSSINSNNCSTTDLFDSVVIPVANERTDNNSSSNQISAAGPFSILITNEDQQQQPSPPTKKKRRRKSARFAFSEHDQSPANTDNVTPTKTTGDDTRLKVEQNVHRRLSVDDSRLIANMSSDLYKRRMSLGDISRSVSMNSVATHSDLLMIARRRKQMMMAQREKENSMNNEKGAVMDSLPRPMLRRSHSESFIGTIKSILKKRGPRDTLPHSPSNKSVVFLNKVQVKETRTLYTREKKSSLSKYFWRDYRLLRFAALITLIFIIIYQVALLGSQWKAQCSKQGLKWLLFSTLVVNIGGLTVVIVYNIVKCTQDLMKFKRIVPVMFVDSEADADGDPYGPVVSEEDDVPILPHLKKRKDSVAIYRDKMKNAIKDEEEQEEEAAATLEENQQPTRYSSAFQIPTFQITSDDGTNVTAPAPTASSKSLRSAFRDEHLLALEQYSMTNYKMVQVEPSSTKSDRTAPEVSKLENVYFQPLKGDKSLTHTQLQIRRIFYGIIAALWIAFHCISLSTLVFVINVGNCKTKAKALYYGNLTYFIVVAVISIIEVVLVFFAIIT